MQALTSRFDSGHLHGAPDTDPMGNGMSRKGKRSCFGSKQMGFESLRPDNGSLAQLAEHSVEARKVAGSIPAGVTRTAPLPHKHSVAMCQPSKLASGVQFPGGALTRR